MYSSRSVVRKIVTAERDGYARLLTSCTAARRMGNEYLYQMLAKENIATLERYGVTTVVTACPHCFHQIGNE